MIKGYNQTEYKMRYLQSKLLTLERSRLVNEQKLLDWVKQFPADSRRFSMIIDSRFQNDFSLIAAKRISKLVDA